MCKLIGGLFSLTALFIFLNGCKHDIPFPKPSGSGTDVTGGTQPCSADTVYFVNKVLPLIVQFCGVIGCHDAITKQDGVQLTNYEMIIRSGVVVPGRPNETKLYEVLSRTGDKRMPKAGPPGNYTEFTQQQKDIIKTWILQGAKNNACNDCDENIFTYTLAIEPLITNKCINCHGGPNVVNTGGGIRLNNYISVVSWADIGKIDSAITHTGLPKTFMPRGGNKLSDCEINQFKKWIDNGYPN
ncbi:MAG: c-type cytochrome domain-containing protein [Ferruginibacter sp.]